MSWLKLRGKASEKDFSTVFFRDKLGGGGSGLTMSTNLANTRRNDDGSFFMA